MNKIINFSGIALSVVLFVTCSDERKELENFIDSRIEFSINQYKLMEESLPEDRIPRSIDENGKLITSGTSNWISGFYPGTLWYLYESSGDEELKRIAHKRTMILENEKNNTGTHDLGFMLYCSFGNGFRLTGNSQYIEIMLTGAHSLLSRYNPAVGLIKSWDHENWQYPVIIDNMMNLEFLFWAAREKEDTSIYNVCISHADKTVQNHFRPDYSTYHVVDYDTITGEVLRKQTHQGYSDESSWARGQAWGLYGFTVMYREAGNDNYLHQAQDIADFLLNHENLPADKIPYWDFNAPDIPNAKRDASAGAIMASALLELSDYTPGNKGQEYFEAAKLILLNLGSDNYLAAQGENGNFILRHGVGNLPNNSEVDVPLSYADYYFIEGLLRLKERLY